MFRNKNINTILIISIFLFSVKWILSFYFFKENLPVRIIFESVTDGKLYYPLVKYLAFFELNNSFDPYIDNLKNIPAVDFFDGGGVSSVDRHHGGSVPSVYYPPLQIR